MRMTFVPTARNAGTFIAAMFFCSHSSLQSTSTMADEVDLREKVKKYEEFVNDKLRTDLETVRKNQEEVNSRISEYLQLKSVIENIKSSEESRSGRELKTQVDLGCNFYCQARIADPSKILVLVGYGFYVEFTLEEALRFIEKKCNQLTMHSQKLGQDSARIKANIKLVLEGLRELQGLRPVEKEPRPIW